MRVLILALSLLLLCGCSQLNGTATHYTLVSTDGPGNLMPPPDRSAYDQSLYSNPDLPYLQDLKNYREYIDQKVAQLEARNGIHRAPAVPEFRISLPVAIEPKFRPRDPSDRDVLLEDALEYATELRDFHRAYVRELSSQIHPEAPQEFSGNL